MVGNILRKRYKIVSQLGIAKNSGFAATYLAQDTDLPDAPQCVVKRIKLDRTNPEFLQLLKPFFQSELQVLAALGKHGQIPHLLTFFAENREFYLVREFIDGSDLSREIGSGERWQEAEVIELMQNILEILHFAHDRNAIHGNIKLQNLIRRHSDGEIVLTDFGGIGRIENLKGSDRERSGMEEVLTDLSTARGGGVRPNPLHPSTDIYDFGKICIHALTGIPPELLRKTSNREIVWHDQTQVSPKLAGIIDKMVHYDRRQRYQSAKEVLQALRSAKNPPTPLDILDSLLEAPPLTNYRSPVVSPKPSGESITEGKKENDLVLFAFASEGAKPERIKENIVATDNSGFAWESLVGFGIAMIAAFIFLSLPTTTNRAKKEAPSPTARTTPSPIAARPTPALPPAIAPSIPLSPSLSVPPLQSKALPSLTPLPAVKPPQLPSLPPVVVPKTSLPPNLSKLPLPKPASPIVALPPSAPTAIVPANKAQPKSQEPSAALNLPEIFEVPLSSAANVNFTQLRALLAAKNWEAADRETKNVMLRAAGRTQEGVMDAESTAKFPCADMQTIDRLWAGASKGRFGFKAQRRIWQNFGGTKAIGLETILKFGNTVGWRTSNSWKTPDNFTFALQAPSGHLPLGSLSASGWRVSSIGEFFSRAKACGL